LLLLSYSAITAASLLKLAGASLILLTTFYLTFLSFDVSATAFLLEYSLVLPFLIFAAGIPVAMTHERSLSTVRAINVGLALLSTLNMVLNYGFPAKLPYVHFLPDAYGALYGLGGAKIVTVSGFIGLAWELGEKKRSPFYTSISIVNFLIPSYLIGTICGIAAFLLTSAKNLRYAVFVLVAVLFGASFFLGRLDSLNRSAHEELGMHPKLAAYDFVLTEYMTHPHVLILGTGLGQFSGEAAQWSSEVLTRFSARKQIPSLPGLRESEFHDRAFASLETVARNHWSLSSSANKPWSSVSTILVETGLPIGVVLLGLFFVRLHQVTRASNQTPILFFVAGLFLLDNWHNSPWLVYLLLLSTAPTKPAFVGDKGVLRPGF
jgi:hypothetical protein